MHFCKKCGSLMVPKKEGKKVVMVCRKCGAKITKVEKSDFKFSTASVKKASEVIVIDKRSQKDLSPETSVQCPKCGYTKASWWVQQTRSGDEPPTRFFKCKNCGHVWREYQ